jgi:hypothetical protein
VAAHDVPLPPERPSPSEIAQFNADAAADPTAEEAPPADKPAATKKKTRHQQ